jgi:hypothetical protein
MKKANRIVAVAVVLFFLAAVGFADYEKIADYYSRNRFPGVQIKTPGGDADIVQKLNLPAVLAVLKYELARKENFRGLSFTERGQLVKILLDSNLVLEYTGFQERMAVTRGGQAIDANLVRFDQAAFYSSGDPRPAHEIAQIILHELGHVWQLRHGTVTRYVVKERWPTYLEANLPKANFEAGVLAQVAALAGGQKRDDDAAGFVAGTVAWEGTWQVTSHWTTPKRNPVTWRFTVEALPGNKCRIRAGGKVFYGTITGNTLQWTDHGQGVHKIVKYAFHRAGDVLTGEFEGKDRADCDISGKYNGSRVGPGA